MKDEANTLLEIHLKELGIPFYKEFRFDKERRWRFDYLLCPQPPKPWNIAIEIEGGIWSRGRHTRGLGFQKDLEKYRAAVIAGYRLLRFSTQEVLSGVAREFIKDHCL